MAAARGAGLGEAVVREGKGAGREPSRRGGARGWGEVRMAATAAAVKVAVGKVTAAVTGAGRRARRRLHPRAQSMFPPWSAAVRTGQDTVGGEAYLAGEPAGVSTTSNMTDLWRIICTAR